MCNVAKAYTNVPKLIDGTILRKKVINMMTDHELNEENLRISREISEKVKKSISDKIRRVSRGEEIAPVKRMTYEEAVATGNVKEMIKYKSGTYAKADRQAEQKNLSENTSIANVVQEIKDIDSKIQGKKGMLADTIEREKAKIDKAFEYEMETYISRGGSPYGVRAEHIRTQYLKALDSIHESDSVKLLERELDDIQDRVKMLEIAKNDYLIRNAIPIAKAKEEKLLREITDAGILDL